MLVVYFQLVEVELVVVFFCVLTLFLLVSTASKLVRRNSEIDSVTFQPLAAFLRHVEQTGKKTHSRAHTVLQVKSDSDFMFCLQCYKGLIIDISLVY